MSFFQIVWKSLKQHYLSTLLAIISIGLGISLLITVDSLREQAHKNLTQEGLGVDAVLGPKGSPLQIILNALYHLDEMPGKIPWSYYERVLKDPIVVSGIPFVTGHSYGGFRVNAVDDSFFSELEFAPGRHFSFAPKDGGEGRIFQVRDEAVAGWNVAQALHIHLGDVFYPVHGVHAGDPVHVHDRIRFVGIMGHTGTPHDRAIYIPLKTFYSLEGHGAAVAAMTNDLASREISGAYLRIKHIRNGVLHPGIQDLKYNVNQSVSAQLVIPDEVLPQLLGIIGWADKVLLAMAILVTLLSAFFLFTSLVSALRERRRDLALMRSLGAGRNTVFGLVIIESLTMTLSGAVLGIIMGHALTGIGAHYINIETGLRFSPWFISTGDYFVIPGILIIGLLAGIIPGLQAYRLNVLDNLTHIS